MSDIQVGTAGWSVPKAVAGHFPAAGSHLQRYGQVFPAAEIDTSFYRHHKPESYAKWAAATPPAFRFAVKTPRVLTHDNRLTLAGDSVASLDRFLGEVRELGPKLGVLLVQLPPSLALSEGEAGRFFAHLRDRHDGRIAVEPRHRTWFTRQGAKLLARHGLARVGADPSVVPEAATPLGDGEQDPLLYYRLHGSPEIYRSAYPPPVLARIVASLRAHAAQGADTWCIFDNTALGHAAADALAVLRAARGKSPVTRARQAIELAPHA